MKKKDNAVDRYVRLEELHEMEDFVPMTLPERSRVRKWVYSGHSVDENPWKYRDQNGYEMNYLDAYHRHLEIMWGNFYRPFYRVIPDSEIHDNRYRETGDEISVSE